MDNKEFKKVLERKTKQLIRDNVSHESIQLVIKKLCSKFVIKLADKSNNITKQEINKEFLKLKKEIK